MLAAEPCMHLLRRSCLALAVVLALGAELNANLNVGMSWRSRGASSQESAEEQAGHG